MALGRWSSVADAAEARTLALGCAGSGVVSLATAAVPFSPTAPRALATGLGVTGLTIGFAMLRAGPRLPRGAVHAVLVLVTVVMSILMVASTTDPGRIVTSYGYVWLAMFTAWFHPRRVAIAHLGLIGAGFGAGLVLAGAPAVRTTWGFVMASVCGVAAALNHLVSALRRSAHRDQLTGLLNRAAFAALAQQHMGLAERAGHPLTLVLIDLDDFKAVNDRHGHAAGDELLVATTAAWGEALRRGDVLARHGGDEFVLLLPATDEAGAGRVLARMRTVHEGGWSAGIAAWRGDDLGAWLDRADGALYADKRSRRATART